jgi:hypothetical protein
MRFMTLYYYDPPGYWSPVPPYLNAFWNQARINNDTIRQAQQSLLNANTANPNLAVQGNLSNQQSPPAPQQRGGETAGKLLLATVLVGAAALAWSQRKRAISEVSFEQKPPTEPSQKECRHRNRAAEPSNRRPQHSSSASSVTIWRGENGLTGTSCGGIYRGIKF